VFSACVLNSFIRNCKDVEIGGLSPIVNTRGALFVHPKGIVRRTTFHVLSMYANKLEKNVLPIRLNSEKLVRGNQSVPVLDAIVTCNDAKNRFVIAVVNKSPDKAVEFAPDFELLTGSSPNDYNDIGSENRVVPKETTLKIKDGKIILPPHSLTFVELQ
jgi:alpha-N-arabinofuranosidase